MELTQENNLSFGNGVEQKLHKKPLNGEKIYCIVLSCILDNNCYDIYTYLYYAYHVVDARSRIS